MDGAAQREMIPDFREDRFGRRFGFASRPELLAASTPLTAADGTLWRTTAIDGKSLDRLVSKRHVGVADLFEPPRGEK